MDAYVDLLPPSYTVKAAPAANDSSRKNQQGKRKNDEPETEAETEAEAAQEPLNVAANLPNGEERRKGEDRRQKSLHRGRWLESRDRNDRRATESAIFVKV